jgi:SAM-dependent methyltransferase
MGPIAAYDEIADWYEYQFLPASTPGDPIGIQASLAELLGTGEGRCLEIGCGTGVHAAQLRELGWTPVGVDLSARMLAYAKERLPIARGDATRLPIGDAALGAVVAMMVHTDMPDYPAVLREVARVLRPGGRWVFSVTHPVRWAFPDDPGPDGLVAGHSYFDRMPYVEQDDAGRATYTEHHRTVGDRVREIVAAGLRLVDLVEPEWPADHTRTWGGWSPLRGRVLPGTAVFVCVKD